MMPYTSTDQPVQDSAYNRPSFCQYCGTKLDIGARFCKNCGQPVASHAVSPSRPAPSFGGNPKERSIVYEGDIHKCPNCGATLAAFVTVCPICGFEIRGAAAATSVHMLELKLEKISAQKMPVFEEKKSVMKKLFGRDLNEENEAKEAAKRFEAQINEEKASLIINYPVPNTKEDILEFMLLAASNINAKQDIGDAVTKAWIAKLDQVYQRATISMRGQPDLDQITNIYKRKKKEILFKKLSFPLSIIGLYGVMLFLLGLLASPVMTICITVGILAICIAIYVIYKKKSNEEV